MQAQNRYPKPAGALLADAAMPASGPTGVTQTLQILFTVQPIAITMYTCSTHENWLKRLRKLKM